MIIPLPARVLGWLGVIPFAAFSIASLTGRLLDPDAAAMALVGYGAVILSFMGGAQWGLTTARADPTGKALWRGLGVSVAPAIAAWGCQALPPATALAGLAACFVGLSIYDAWTVGRGEAPAWYGRLRAQLTVAVVICLIAPFLLGVGLFA